MTITYMTRPQNKLTLGSTALENVLTHATVTRLENGFDSARIILPDTTYYPSTVTEGTTVQLEVKEAGGSYTTIFVGTVRFITAEVSAGNVNSLVLNCRSIGAGLAEMLVATDYGSQSANKIDTITEMITNTTDGIIPNYVQKIFGGSSSNYAYDTSYVETFSDVIPYISSPYKPANKFLNDLVDLYTAYKGGSTCGPHWIVTYAGGTNYLRMKLLTADQTGWTKYYGGSQANATLTYGTDYTKISLEKMAAEANYIVYYGAWRRPSDGDSWTENNSEDWAIGDDMSINDYPAPQKVVNSYAIGAHIDATPDGPFLLSYPSTKDAAWDFSGFTEFNTPNLNVYLNPGVIKGGGTTTDWYCLLYTDASNWFYCVLEDWAGVDVWTHFSIPIGPYFNVQGNTTKFKWSESGSPDWSNINWIEFGNASVTNSDGLYVDGLHFGDASVCRVASLSDYTGVIVKQKLIVDDIGKDDSLISSDDTGLMAKMALSELLRLKTNNSVGTVETNMIKDLLPGQWLYIQSTDYRATKITHNIKPVTNQEYSYTSTIEITDDILNGRARTRYEDINKQWESVRPEWQDKQSSSIKAGKVDWRVNRLVKTY